MPFKKESKAGMGWPHPAKMMDRGTGCGSGPLLSALHGILLKIHALLGLMVSGRNQPTVNRSSFDYEGSNPSGPSNYNNF